MTPRPINSLTMFLFVLLKSNHQIIIQGSKLNPVVVYLLPGGQLGDGVTFCVVAILIGVVTDTFRFAFAVKVSVRSTYDDD